jgi:hypothetical protein
MNTIPDTWTVEDRWWGFSRGFGISLVSGMVPLFYRVFYDRTEAQVLGALVVEAEKGEERAQRALRIVICAKMGLRCP